MKNYDLIIVGAGSAGLLAAISAKRFSKNILIIEKNKSAGKKLKLTGNGRCNLTNVASINTFIEAFNNKKFLYPSFNNFFSNDIIKLLENNNIYCIKEADGKIFPKNHNANDLVNALLNELKDINILYNQNLIEVLIKNNQIEGVKTNNNIYFSNKLIIATGGASYPDTGSDASNFEIIKKTKHKITKIMPALVGLEASSSKQLQGISLNNIDFKIIVDNKKKYKVTGSVLFTHYGISGPLVIDYSAFCIEAILNKKKVLINLDLLKDFKNHELEIKINQLLKQHSKKLVVNVLSQLLPYKLIKVILLKLNIDLNAKELTKAEKNKLIHLIKNFDIEIYGSRGFNEAMLTRGGVLLDELNPKTLESKIIQGLYFAGEVLDIDAKSGGYNLQAAFSSGWLAGQCIK